jgi:rhomboid family protein
VGGMIPLTDASRRPMHFPVVTTCIVLTNVFAFALELARGDTFILQWSAIPANILTGHHWITLFTAMFMHASWSHIIGNMVFLWAFGPEIEDAMNGCVYNHVLNLIFNLHPMRCKMQLSQRLPHPSIGRCR